ncbi:hypothetical protein ZWY2020_052196, partial [Hordeum vulgare]
KFFVRDMEEVTQRMAYLKTKDGFNFKCTFYNEVDHTYFRCANWKGLAKAYGFEAVMKIPFDIGTYSLSDEDICVDLDLMPILPPCKYYSTITYLLYLKLTTYFLSPRNIQNIVDDTYYTAYSILTWQEKGYLVFFVANIESLKGIYGAGPNDARYLALVHTLNKGNICIACHSCMYIILTQ